MMNYLLVACSLFLGGCGGSQDLKIYDVVATTTLYECWDIPAPDPIQMVIGIDQSAGKYHLYTCDDTCGDVQVEVAASSDGTNFSGEINTSEDSRGCSVHSTLTATVSRSGKAIDITEHSVEIVSEGCDTPGTCTQDVTVTGTKR